MRVFVTGATGFIGRALVPRLQRDGHTIVAWTRAAARARAARAEYRSDVIWLRFG